MADKKISRRLAAVLHADVAGYSRLMQDDERATLQALTEHRSLFAARVCSHSGRIVNAPGDSIFAEFASVVDAVECAAELQETLAQANAGLPQARRMNFRIGINVGDVLVDDAGIYPGQAERIVRALGGTRCQGRYDEAIRHMRICSTESPTFAFARFALAAAFALAGRMPEAHVELAEFRRLRPGVGTARLRAQILGQNPKYLELRERVYDGLRLGGLEE